MRKVKGKLVLKDGSVYEGDLYGNRNAVGEVVFFKEIGTVDLAFKEGVEVQDSRTSVGGVN